MSLHQYYSNRIETFQLAFKKAQSLENKLVFLRLCSFIAAILLFFLLINTSTAIAIIALLTGLIVFGYFVKQNIKVALEKQFYQYLSEINEKELRCTEGDYSAYPDGSEYQEKDHAYAVDLDIFGKASLFQLINRTASLPGSKKLAHWLKHPADIKEILKRQEAIAELSPKTEWRQKLMAIEYKYAKANNNPESMIRWIKEEPLFLTKKYLKPLIIVLSVLTILLIFATFTGLQAGYLVITLLINIIIVFRATPSINKIHNNVTKTSEILKSYAEIIKLIESKIFRSQKLIELRNTFLNEKGNGSYQIRYLAKLVNMLDFRLNVMVSIPLNLLFFWDILQTLRLEKWKTQSSMHITEWFDAMAEYETLSSISNLYFNNPAWIMPVISNDFYKLNAREIGHPLIPEVRRICNNLEINSHGKIVLITGSNMSGKSTFLRTCGVNIVLAMTGAPVCAKKMEVSHVLVLTSMRNTDSLEENTSSFYAELKRLAYIIHTIEQKEKVFLLLDEILRGTNSNDRHIGSEALIKQLIKSNAAGILATHDLELSHLEQELPQHIDNYNFDVKIENDELYFDYILNKGICKSLNASILMKKMGIKLNE
jgi:hypothetical protein